MKLGNAGQNSIYLMGLFSNPYPYMKAGEVFRNVLSVFRSTYPTVLCEAMDTRRPVVVTNCSGCRELVDMGK
jgi:hypothetical protein